ncbi:uncharacterized protein LOC9630019 [Selaginella moellendorffii]|nr:uncharacterized protein LOC9630019 [Selaginella moellendorffii]|eukprot:XP_024536434.1 uncharacterized protein LOC9630019 [Selaginella moellendorffii]
MASHLAAQEPPEEEAERDVRESGQVDDDMKLRVLELLRRCEKWKKFKGFRKYYLTSVPTEDDVVVVHPLEKSTTAEQWKHVITYNRTCSQRSCEILYTLLRSEYFPPEHNNGRYMILHVWRGEQHPDAVWPSSFTKRARRRRNKKYREEFHARSSSPPVQLQAYCVGEGNDQVSSCFSTVAAEPEVWPRTYAASYRRLWDLVRQIAAIDKETGTCPRELLEEASKLEYRC